jgi:hypothetical protein
VHGGSKNKQTTIVSADRETVASGGSFVREAQPYIGTASIAGRNCNAQQVYRPPTTKKDRPQPVFWK